MSYIWWYVLIYENSVMQGREGMDRTFLDAASVVGHLVDPGSMFAFLAAHRGELFPEEMFADLFPSVEGASSIPGSVMASVMTLQTLHDYSDRETAEAVRCDLRWKVACGLALDDAGFHPTTLVYWRRRLAKSDRPHRINDAVKSVIAQTGILRGRRRRAVDSTILADAVATQDTITQLIAAVRRVARVVPGAADLVAAVCTGHDYSTAGKPRIDWEDPQAKDGLVSALVNDALALVNALAEGEITPEESEAVALLALVAGQDVEPAEGSDGTDGRWKIAHRVAEDRVISTVDPEARHTRKSPEARRDGYRAHLVAEPGTGLITDEELTQAAGPDNCDPAIAETFLANDIADNTRPPEPNPPTPTRRTPTRRRTPMLSPAARTARLSPSGDPRWPPVPTTTRRGWPSWCARGSPTPRTGPGTCGRRSRRPGTGR